MIDSPNSDEGFIDVSNKLAALEKLSSTEKAELAFLLMSQLPDGQRSEVMARLESLKCRDFISALPLELSIYILSLLDMQTVGSSVSKAKGWTLSHASLQKLSSSAAASSPVSATEAVTSGQPQIQEHRKHWTAGSGESRRSSSECVLRSLGSSSKALLVDEERATVQRVSEDMVDWKQVYRAKHELSLNWDREWYETREVQAHDDGIYTLQYDGTKIITGSRDTKIKVWDAKTLKCLHELVGHTQSVLCLQYDSTYLISGSSDHTIIVWEMGTYKKLKTIAAHNDSVLSVSFSGDLLVSASKDRSVKLWNISTGSCFMTLFGHHAAVNSVILKGGHIATASGDRTIKLWDKDGKLLKTFIGHARGIACLAYDGETLVSGSSDHQIRIWNISSGNCDQHLQIHSDLVRSLSLDTDKIVSGSYDMSIKVLDRHTGRLLHDFQQVHSQRIYKVQVTNGKIISCAQDGKIVILDFTKGIKHPELFY